jgi:hypothetical protein
MLRRSLELAQMPSGPPRSEESATLVINSDYSYCSACGGGALLNESAHLTLLGRETAAGWILPPAGAATGCGATFTATATDPFAKEMAVGIMEVRPDLPFLGRHGAEARD